MIGKIILPWFGGTPAVWTTVMLFFQVLLMSGYAYAFWLINRVKNTRQSIVHIILSIFAIILLTRVGLLGDSPFALPGSMKPSDDSSPVFDIFKLLVLLVAPSYFILSSNGPLMQAWYSRIYPQRSYARLYAISNLGSLLGLLSYPVIVEPYLSLKDQGWAWFLGFIVFGLLAIFIAIQNARSKFNPKLESKFVFFSNRPSSALKLLWIILSGTASLLLLSITNQISQEVAVIPFLWVLPLTLYLLSFIITFSSENGYNRKLFLVLFTISLALLVIVLFKIDSIHLFFQIFSYCLLLFSSCMLCHGELYILRPDANHLTTYYMMISVGGALGGVYASLIAPLIFNGYWEFMVALALAIAVAVWLIVTHPVRAKNHLEWVRFMCFVFFLFTVTMTFFGNFSGILFSERNFYGVIRVKEMSSVASAGPAYTLTHGLTLHGLQFIKTDARNLPTAYYTPKSGIGLVLKNHPNAAKGMRVGVLGLGIGTLAAYGQPGDEYRFYEINPAVIGLAKGQRDYFTYLKNCKAHVTTILGDARISLERELANGNAQRYDVFVLDTFSSDSIPMHLMTKEAFDLYLKHLAPDGIIAAHISNQHLDLRPVIWKLAQYYGMQIISINYPGDEKGGYPSNWLLLTRNQTLMEIPSIQEHAEKVGEFDTSSKLWTDNYSNLFQILK